MDTSLKLHGLVAAVHTPFKADGSLNPSSVDAQAKLLASQGIKLAFITGSTGESSSMQLEERKEIYSAWKEASAKHAWKLSPIPVPTASGTPGNWPLLPRNADSWPPVPWPRPTTSPALFSAWWNAAPSPPPALPTCPIITMISPC